MLQNHRRELNPEPMGRPGPRLVAAATMAWLIFGACSKEVPTQGPPNPPSIPKSPGARATGVDLCALVTGLFAEGGLDDSIEGLDRTWRPGSAAALVDFLRVSYHRQQPGFRGACFAVIALLEAKSGQAHGGSISAWYRWLWDQGRDEHEDAARIKASLFERIDPRFAQYFGEANSSGGWDPWPRRIRLDEVRWGGVEQDGIPPLRQPRVLPATEAGATEDHHVVYGVEINGEARAYPRRILGWHELVTDRLGGVDITGVYCTLCGTMIVYESKSMSGAHTLGTSGFLYRSNKLMYDAETQSLWSTLLGEPVIGPLANSGAQLPRRATVATTWGEWRRRHPKTTVLSDVTGFDRSYAEGAAYADYYATDELMFDVPSPDERLANKAEVIGLALEGSDGTTAAVALSVDFLRAHPQHVENFQDRRITLITDASGAVRAYELPKPAPEVQGAAADGDLSQGVSGDPEWDLKRCVEGGKGSFAEDALTSSRGTRAPRISSTRSFWFAWHAAHPKTRLRKQ